MYGDLYDYLLGQGKKVECTRCHREFDEDADELEPGMYGEMLCRACRTPTMSLYIPYDLLADAPEMPLDDV